MIGSKAFDSVAKNPDLRGSLQFMMVIAMGFVESIAVYCLLVAIFLIFLT
jgi:ATP synthase F0 subunit c